jgi:hypothetical protein
VPSGSGNGDQSAQNGSKRGIEELRKQGMGRSRGKEDNKGQQQKIGERCRNRRQRELEMMQSVTQTA